MVTAPHETDEPNANFKPADFVDVTREQVLGLQSRGFKVTEEPAGHSRFPGAQALRIQSPSEQPGQFLTVVYLIISPDTSKVYLSSPWGDDPERNNRVIELLKAAVRPAEGDGPLPADELAHINETLFPEGYALARFLEGHGFVRKNDPLAPGSLMLQRGSSGSDRMTLRIRTTGDKPGAVADLYLSIGGAKALEDLFPPGAPFRLFEPETGWMLGTCYLVKRAG